MVVKLDFLAHMNQTAIQASQLHPRLWIQPCSVTWVLESCNCAYQTPHNCRQSRTARRHQNTTYRNRWPCCKERGRREQHASVISLGTRLGTTAQQHMRSHAHVRTCRLSSPSHRSRKWLQGSMPATRPAACGSNGTASFCRNRQTWQLPR
jgi:hypothetical protein